MRSPLLAAFVLASIVVGAPTPINKQRSDSSPSIEKRSGDIGLGLGLGLPIERYEKRISKAPSTAQQQSTPQQQQQQQQVAPSQNPQQQPDVQQRPETQLPSNQSSSSSTQSKGSAPPSSSQTMPQSQIQMSKQPQQARPANQNQNQPSGSGSLVPVDQLDLGLASNTLRKRGMDAIGSKESIQPLTMTKRSVPLLKRMPPADTKRDDGRVLRKRGRDFVLEDPVHNGHQWGGAYELSDEDDEPFW